MSTPPLARPPYTPPDLPRQTVVLTGIDMSIPAMCRFMIRWAIAAIPAAIIFWLLFTLIMMLFAPLFYGLMRMIPHRF